MLAAGRPVGQIDAWPLHRGDWARRERPAQGANSAPNQVADGLARSELARPELASRGIIIRSPLGQAPAVARIRLSNRKGRLTNETDAPN